ncbi:FAD-dependent oxidoreductase, partial [Ruegeria sp. NA]|nr:FAD-dependent oxidoreductase [Ruegeria sp. NA]
MDVLRRYADETGILHQAAELPALGMGGAFFGGYTLPVGFGLNPRKCLFGLASAAAASGANFFQNSPVL